MRFVAYGLGIAAALLLIVSGGVRLAYAGSQRHVADKKPSTPANPVIHTLTKDDYRAKLVADAKRISKSEADQLGDHSEVANVFFSLDSGPDSDLAIVEFQDDHGHSALIFFRSKGGPWKMAEDELVAQDYAISLEKVEIFVPDAGAK